MLNLTEREQKLVLMLAIMALSDDDNSSALHLEAGDDLQDFDALQLKLHEQFPEERSVAFAAAVRVLDGNFDNDEDEEEGSRFYLESIMADGDRGYISANYNFRWTDAVIEAQKRANQAGHGIVIYDSKSQPVEEVFPGEPDTWGNTLSYTRHTEGN